jgi:UDP-N-acetylmuramoylalanine--D-glutamate ligase
MRLKFHRNALPGLKITVMGLGLNGGGIEAARFFAAGGADVTVTDLRGEDILRPSLEKLSGLPVRYVLGRHDEKDFRSADLVIKNPAVRPDSPYLRAAKNVETDISIFLALCPAPIIAVTGSKGKSSTASALHFALRRIRPGVRLGGNITVSPLSFLGELSESDPVVLELSSWQLGDLPDPASFKPKIAILTNIHPDHLDRYSGMDDYVKDKRLIYAGQGRSDYTICNYDDSYGRSFAEETPGTAFFFSRRPLPEGTLGAFLDGDEGFVNFPGDKALIVPGDLQVIGPHQRMNMLAAGLALVLFGVSPRAAADGLAAFPGIEHRIELCGERRGVKYYNDSAATIPEALTAAVSSFSGGLHLITGGTDKNLDFSVFREAAHLPKAIYLLQGTATPKIQRIFDAAGRTCRGPYAALEEAVRDAAAAAEPGDSVILSPGCTSFGLFLNEFDRGNKFKAAVRDLTAGGA